MPGCPSPSAPHWRQSGSLFRQPHPPGESGWCLGGDRKEGEGEKEWGRGGEEEGEEGEEEENSNCLVKMCTT